MRDHGREDDGAPGAGGAPVRRIAVMRHGKAEQEGRTDFERPIAERGQDDSADTGAWLARWGFTPDHAIVSAALRTVGTWESITVGSGWTLDPELSHSLYAAGPDTALDLLRESPSTAIAVIVVGHNPTMASLASILDDGDGDPGTAADMMSGFPTSAVALFEFVGDWRDLDEASARLVAFHVGRG